MLCDKCNKVIDNNSQFCKYCGQEQLLKKPMTLKELANAQGIENPIHISWKESFLEEHGKEWDTYNEQQDRIKNGQFNRPGKPKLKNFLKEVSMPNFGLLVCGIMLLGAIMELPYGYYRLLRAVITVVSFYIALFQYSIIPVKIFLVIAVILFNPFTQFEFVKDTWIIIDFAFGAVYLAIMLLDHFKILTLTSNKD